MDDRTANTAVLSAILDTAVDAIVVADEQGKILRVNSATAQLFQYETDELIGQSVNILMPRAMADLHDSFMDAFVQTGEKKIIGTGRDVEGQRKDKSVFPLHLSVGHSKVAETPIFVAILHDLTARKSTQDALARSQRLDAIGQMTGGIAHDFNNLLTVITGNLELLEMRGATERQLPLIQDALESAELGADLTSRLMIFARKGTLAPVRSDLRSLCSETLSLLKRTLGETYRIKTDFAPELDAVMIDPAQLQSALVNLALNARDAMGTQGELLVSVENVTIDDTYMAQETDIGVGDYVRLSVSDTGEGMSLEAQRRAFEPFFTTKTNSGGTGLGLAMVYGFVRQSGGHITLYSELGFGTNFGLYFPAIPADVLDQTVQQAEDTNKGLRAKGKTILIVEDNTKVRKLSIARIEDLGFDTLAAEDADAAYAMLRDGADVDLVFSDLVMPGDLNGYDLAAKVKAEFPTVKILLTSGYASDAVTDSLSPHQHYDILHKPYRQAEIAARLHALLGEDADS